MAQEKIYSSIIEKLFKSKFKPGMREVPFDRQDIVAIGNDLKISIPKNLGDLIYSFRYRKAFPESIQSTADEGESWVIRPAGRSKYVLTLIANMPIIPRPDMIPTKIPDSTPGIVAKYAFNDEQALLAKVRYNRLVDIFLGIACYSLQNHLRTTVPGMGQVETDEIYVGLDKQGVHYVIPVQAKGGTDKLNIVQIEQDFGVCAKKFPTLISRPIAAQFLKRDTIALFEFGNGESGVGVVAESHYKLVPPSQVTQSDLEDYKKRLGV